MGVVVTFEFMKQVDDVLFYNYYPNCDGLPGEVSISVDGEIWELVKLAPDNEAGTFAEHALMEIYDRLMDGEIPKNGMVAWY